MKFAMKLQLLLSLAVLALVVLGGFMVTNTLATTSNYKIEMAKAGNYNKPLDQVTPADLEWFTIKDNTGEFTAYGYEFEKDKIHPFAVICFCPKHNGFEITFMFTGNPIPVPKVFATELEAKQVVENVAWKMYDDYLKQKKNSEASRNGRVTIVLTGGGGGL